MNQIEKHIKAQTSVMSDWLTASPQIRARIMANEKRLATLEAARSKDSSLIASLLKRIESLEQRPTGLGSLFK